MNLPPQIKQAFDYIDALSIRERGLVAITTLALLWAAWDGLLMQPLRAVEAARQDQLDSLTGQVRDLNQTIQRIATGQSGAPPDDVRQRLATLRAINAELDEELRTLLLELVEPQDMASLLETMLTETGNLELVRMHALAAQPIAVENVATGYFRHGLSMQVRGSYLDTLRYLQALEQLRWKFLWDSVEIEVEEHPSASITIIVYTLGRSPGAIGV